MTSYTPLLIRAHLAAGIAQAAPWGIALDSLLAAQLWAQEKRRIRATGAEPANLHDTAIPADLPLPLARCELAGDLWHWAATTAWPEGRPGGLGPDVHTWTGRLDHRNAEHLADSLPKIVSSRQGRYRSRRMPLLVTICTAVTWTAIGDPARVAEILTPIRAIGKKRSTGEGHVLRWEITPRSDLDHWTAGHQHPDGSLGRPTPAACLEHVGSIIHDGGIGTAGLRPPYMHRQRQHTLHLPAFLDAG